MPSPWIIAVRLARQAETDLTWSRTPSQSRLQARQRTIVMFEVAIN